jgi:hypothetical protein
MPDLTADDIAEAASQPASASSDGQSAAAHPIPDQIEAAKFQATGTGLDGTNDNGGPRSGWNRLRTARARNGGPV